MTFKSLKFAPNSSVLLAFLFGLGLVSCSSPGEYVSSAKPSASITPSPTPEKTPEPPETNWKCKILNGEGRVFKGIGDTSLKAERIARHECELYSHHCVLLGCNPIVGDE